MHDYMYACLCQRAFECSSFFVLAVVFCGVPYWRLATKKGGHSATISRSGGQAYTLHEAGQNKLGQARTIYVGVWRLTFAITLLLAAALVPGWRDTSSHIIQSPCGKANQACATQHVVFTCLQKHRMNNGWQILRVACQHST